MKPGNPSLISEWLARSQKVPLTVIAEFSDIYEHSPCRHEDPASATPANITNHKVCPRHKAVFSLNQLLPHRSRIHDLDVLIRSSDPDWREYYDESEQMLLYHRFFTETLPNLQRLDFRATHVEAGCMVPVPKSLFAGGLPRLKELKYLGVTGGLAERAKNLVSCEIGHWSGSAGPNIIFHDDLEALFNNNKNVRSLVLNNCEFLTAPGQPFTTPMTDLKLLRIHCPIPGDLETILKCIHVPQFKSLDTVQLSIHSTLQVMATDGSGHTFGFSQLTEDGPNFYPLRHLGAEVTTVRLDRGMTIEGLGCWPGLFKFFHSLGPVRVLEFDGAVSSVKTVFFDILSVAGVFRGLKVLRVVIGWDSCKEALELLAELSRERMEEGNPFSAIEPLSAGGVGEGGLDPELRVEWEKHYEAQGIQNFLFK